MNKCPKCGKEFENGNFCSDCGTRLVPSNACPSCGYENEPKAKFCLKCGTQLAGNSAHREEARQSTATLSEEEIKAMYSKVSSGSYIGNLRVGRSWVLPQMVSMCFPNGRFDERNFFAKVESKNYDRCWALMVRNFHVQSQIESKDPGAYAARSGWWTKEVALAMARYDYELLLRLIDVAEVSEYCSGGPYVRLKGLKGRKKEEQMFFVNEPNANSRWKDCKRTLPNLRLQFENRIKAIEQANTSAELFHAVKAYDDIRCKAEVAKRTYRKIKLPDEFVNAFVGDGAYTSMMTMVKFLGLTYSNDMGLALDRDGCIADINHKMREFGFDGRKMFDYCKKKFFVSGLYTPGR